MFDKLKSRYVVYSFFVLAMFVFMGAGLWQLTILQGQENTKKSEMRTTKEIKLQGQRGRILDRNGLPLAYNQKSYDIQFYRNPSNKTRADYARYTQILIDVIDIVEAGGGKTINTFAVRRDENFNFHFDWGNISADAAKSRETSWRTDMFGKGGNAEKRTPEEIYRTLRRTYEIPEELGYEQAVKLLSIWQEVTRNASKAYVPIKIAYNVPIETVAQLELKTIEFEGISTTEGSVRIYPQGDLAAHIIGYMGRIDDRLDVYEEMGYKRDDLIGKTGIEQSMEEHLTGNTNERSGKKLVEINSQAKVTRSLEKQPPTDGNDVILTIDLYLQKVVETALENNIHEIHRLEEQELLDNPDPYEKSFKDPSKIRLAEFGAAVVMDIKSGDVLAMASYPSFDLNIFTGGISEEELKALVEGDAERTTPLYNKATKSKAAPGSIFKMATALAGLQEGAITTTDTISDHSPFTDYLSASEKASGVTPADAPNCWIAPRTADHANLNVENALRVSCNYFFSSVAYKLGIDGLNKWAHKLGLDSPTNIELDGEAVGQIGGQAVIYDRDKELDQQRISRPRLVVARIKERLAYFCNALDLEADEEAIDHCTKSLLLLVERNAQIGEQVRQIMSDELSIPKPVSQTRLWFQQITNLLNELRWTPAETVRTGFGQSLTLVTPVAAARYISALVNGGHVYDAHVVRRIVDSEGKILVNKEPVVYDELNASQVNIDAIIKGMEDAVSPEDRGTAGTAFKGYEYKDEIGGKTGTAQIGTSKAANIDLENTSWFACYAPRENPEIAIIIYIPYGWKGALSASSVKDIVSYYMDRKIKQAPENIPAANSPVA